MKDLVEILIISTIHPEYSNKFHKIMVLGIILHLWVKIKESTDVDSLILLNNV